MDAVIVYIIFGMVAKIMKENKSQVDNATYDILTWGVRYSGVIVDYCDGEGKAKDGITPLDLIVRLNKGENWYEVQAASGGYMESDYPIGANCEIAIAGTQAVLVPGTVCTN